MLRGRFAGPFRRLAGRGTVLDVVAAVVVVGVFWVPPAAAAGDRPRMLAGVVLALVTVGATALRRRCPAASTVAAAVATVAGTVLGVCQDPMLATAWCLYPLAVARAPRTRTVVLLLAGLLVALSAVTAVPDGDAGGAGQRLVVAVAALCVSWVLGTTTGRQVAAAREAERARVRLEVARDVHDVVGHALAVIGAEAGVTRSLPDAGERELRESLEGVETHARGALQEVQALVRALRTPAEAAGAPRLSAVVAATRAAGVRVEARISVPEPAGDAAGVTAARIVQEALSNVVRHAAGADCAVDVREEGGAIVVRVRDHGPGARPGGGAGVGLRGVRERARLVGGTATWGDHPDGGFEVEARLPRRGPR